MNAQQFARLKEILLALAQLPEGERVAYLDRVCADDPDLRHRVEAILESGRRVPRLLGTGGVGDLLQSALAEAAGSPSTGTVPERIGPYRIQAMLGEGGMGIVYRALQEEPIRREVALKLIRRGLDSEQVVARFQAERQVLALMSHPNIATVLDAGADETGRPYFVMELARGVPITEYCREHELRQEERITLFRTVCLAVQHAHQKGIIHRDLKPSNILVSRQDEGPLPKLIDFGIAKALEEPEDRVTRVTRDGQIVGTLEYMSPEQIEGATARVDTRSDIYSLGVILYELLTGELPYEVRGRTTLEVLRTVCEQSPRRLRGAPPAAGRFDTEIETIVQKALEKEPDRRYGSAGALADDLERYLKDEPILARPASAAYHLRKLVARHPGVSVLASALLLFLVGFAVTMSALRDRAVLERRKAEQISAFLMNMLDANHLEGEGRETRLAEVLASGERQIARLDAQPLVQVQVQRILGDAYRTLGFHEEGEAQLRAALATLVRQPDPDAAEVAVIQESLSELLLVRGKHSEAESLLQRSLALWRRSPRGGRLGVARSSDLLARTRLAQGRIVEAEPLFRESMEIYRRELGDTAEAVASSRNNLAVLLWGQGRLAEAEPLYSEALATYTRIHGERHTDVATMKNNVAVLLVALGRYREAETIHRRALALRRELLGTEHEQVGNSLANLADCLGNLGADAEAEQLYREALRVYQGVLGADHPDNGYPLEGLGYLTHLRGETQAAESLFDAAVRVRARGLSESHPLTSTTRVHRAALWIDTGRAAQAEPELRNAVAALRQAFPGGKWEVGVAENALARCLARLGRREEADSLFAASFSSFAGAPVFWTRLAAERTAEIFRSWGRFEEAGRYRSLVANLTASPTDLP